MPKASVHASGALRAFLEGILVEVAAIGPNRALDQVWYSLGGERGLEHALMPWLAGRPIPLMAYSPIDQGRASSDATLAGIAEARGPSPTQPALGRLLTEPGVVAIPKATGAAHLRENLVAAGVVFTALEKQAIDEAFPCPSRRTSLAMN